MNNLILSIVLIIFGTLSALTSIMVKSLSKGDACFLACLGGMCIGSGYVLLKFS